jgi:hypothetical protein
MIDTYHKIREDSFRIAWDYLDATDELDEPEAAAIFLLDIIETMMKRGEYRKLLLSNRAIDAHKRSRKVRRRDFALVS